MRVEIIIIVPSVTRAFSKSYVGFLRLFFKSFEIKYFFYRNHHRIMMKFEKTVKIALNVIKLIEEFEIDNKIHNNPRLISSRSLFIKYIAEIAIN